MQVSWIDPDEIARLAAELNGPLPSAEPVSWDLNTLPEITADALMPQFNQAHTPSQPTAFDPFPAQGSPDTHSVAQPELNHIREKLRAIRTRAQDAGLLPPKEAPQATPAPAAASAVTQATENGTPNTSQPLPPSPAAENSTPSPAASAHSFLNLDGSLTERLASFMTWAGNYVSAQEILLVDDHGELLWGNPSHPELALSAVLAANANLHTGAQAITQQPVASVRLSESKHLTVLPCPTRLGLVTLALLNVAPALSNDQVSCLREALTLSVEGKS
jgi:hypothetical protein